MLKVVLQLKTYSPVPNNKGVLIKGRAEWDPADDLNINKRRAGVSNFTNTQGIFKYMYLNPP